MFARFLSVSVAIAESWWPVRVAHESVEKALAVWMNSSLDLLTIAVQRTSTERGWVALKKAALQQLPVLDVRHLSPAQRQHLAHLFDQLTEAEFQRLPTMSHCPAPRAIDEGLSKVLALPDLNTLRGLLASEPVISNQRL